MKYGPPLGKSKKSLLKGGCRRESGRGVPIIQNLCADNYDYDHHRDGDPSLIIIRTKMLGIQKYYKLRLSYTPITSFSLIPRYLFVIPIDE